MFEYLQQDLFNSGGWNNNNSSHRNSNRSNEESNRSSQEDSKRSSKSSDDQQVPITLSDTKITVTTEESNVTNKPSARQELLRKTLDSEKQRPRSFTPGGIRLLPNNAELLRKLPKKSEDKKTEPNTLSPESSQNMQNQNRKSVPVFSNNDTYMQNSSSTGIDSDPSGYAQVRSDMDLTSVTTSSNADPPTVSIGMSYYAISVKLFTYDINYFLFQKIVI